jgi:hypothetical protein
MCDRTNCHHYFILIRLNNSHQVCSEDFSPHQVCSEDFSPHQVCSEDFSPHQVCSEDFSPHQVCSEDFSPDKFGLIRTLRPDYKPAIEFVVRTKSPLQFC